MKMEDQQADLFPINPERVCKSIKLEPIRLFCGHTCATSAMGTPTSDTTTPIVTLTSDTPAAGTPMNETPATGTPTDDTPATGTSKVDTPATSNLTCDIPAIGTPTGDIPATGDARAIGDTPADDTPATGTPTSKTPSTGISKNDTHATGSLPRTPSTTTPLHEIQVMPTTPERGSSSKIQSPFSKYLKYPMMPPTKSKKRKIMPMPKAMTGHAYRNLLQEKIELKKQEERETLRRKEERLRKKQLKEEQDKLKKQIQIARKKARIERIEKKKEAAEKVLDQAMESDSDDAKQVVAGKCYSCEHPYGNDFIECENCFRSFHINCVQDQIIDGIPFECKYC